MIHKSTLLPCSPARAFELFTGHASTWWPPERRHTGDPQSSIRLTSDGLFVETGASGKVVDLGHITRWDPPHRLEVDFYVASGKDQPTLLVVTFAAEGTGTRVSIQHGPGPRSADVWTRRASAFESAWSLLLPALERHAVDHP